MVEVPEQVLLANPRSKVSPLSASEVALVFVAHPIVPFWHDAKTKYLAIFVEFRMVNDC
jgi:hypothetical protein